MNDTKSSYETNILYREYISGSSYPWEDFQREGIMYDEEEEYHSTMVDDGLYCTYLQKKTECCFNVHRNGNGMHLTPRPMLAGVGGNDLHIRIVSRVYDGKDFMLGCHSPFRNIPILKWIL